MAEVTLPQEPLDKGIQVARVVTIVAEIFLQDRAVEALALQERARLHQRVEDLVELAQRARFYLGLSFLQGAAADLSKWNAPLQDASLALGESAEEQLGRS
jgi:hypothetical protein